MKLLILLLLSFNIFLKETKDDVEPIKNNAIEEYILGIGPYYIVYSPYDSGYDRATSFVELPLSLETKNGKKCGNIGFGILTSNGTIDMGIKNCDDYYWFPYYFDKINNITHEQKNFISTPKTKKIGLEMKIIKKKIQFSISLRDSHDLVLDSYTYYINAPHLLEYDDIKLRFYRFAALMPNSNITDNDDDDQNDGTYMEGGNFTRLTICKNDECTSWGIEEKDIEGGWKVYSKKIDLKYSYNRDSFSIKNYSPKNDDQKDYSPYIKLVVAILILVFIIIIIILVIVCVIFKKCLKKEDSQQRISLINADEREFSFSRDKD